MNTRNIFRLSSLFLVAVLLAATPASAQKRQKGRSAQAPVGRAVIWESVDVRRQDTFLGPGGEEMQPDLSKVTFVRQEKGGYSTKYRIKDGSGNTWVAKLGREAQSETAAVRLLSALGYKTEINYLVPRLTIPGKGTFTNVRLEARPSSVNRGEVWRWEKNPFQGTHQLEGLKIMMAFIANWDMKNANNVILNEGGRQNYVISDLGVSFGKTGSNGLPLFWMIGRSRNNPEDYSKAKFVKGVKRGHVKLNFNGKNRHMMRSISVADARWLADLLTRLSDRQIRDAFRAANYTPAEVSLLTAAVKERIRQLDRVADEGDRYARTR